MNAPRGVSVRETNRIISAARTRLAVFLFSTRAIPLFIALATFVAFSPALWNGLVEWDDHVNLVNNPDYRGLGWKQLRWMFTTVLMGQYIPLTWMTFGADYLLWGMNPFGYHLTSLLLHTANAGVFYFVALRLLRQALRGPGETTLRLGAAAAALLFAIHPLRAESVAWVTERRDVLSGLFFLLTILTYLKACEAEGARRRRWLAGSVGLYFLSLSSKSMGATLPIILILLDIYPLDRLGGRWQEWIAPGARKVWVEKLPYLLLALAAVGMALYAMLANSFLTSLENLPFAARVALAFYSLWFYLWKTLLPLGLVPLYELPSRVNPLDPQYLVGALAVTVITGGLIVMRRRWPAGLAVWVSYVVMLAPVSGIVHNGFQLANDRYSYLPCLGWALLGGAAVCVVARARASGKLGLSFARLAVGAGVVWFIGFGVLTWQQVQVWRDTDTLWRHALEFSPDCAICHGNLGVILYNKGYAAVAIEHLQRVLTLKPNHVKAHINVGLALAALGRPSESVEHFQLVLEHHPTDVDARTHLGMALVQQGKPEEAVEQLRQAIQLNPIHVGAHTNLGNALAELGNPGEAIAHYRRAIELKPEFPHPHLGLARAYLALGKTGSAQEEYEILKRLDQPLATRLSPLVDR